MSYLEFLHLSFPRTGRLMPGGGEFWDYEMDHVCESSHCLRSLRIMLGNIWNGSEVWLHFSPETNASWNRFNLWFSMFRQLLSPHPRSVRKFDVNGLNRKIQERSLSFWLIFSKSNWQIEIFNDWLIRASLISDILESESALKCIRTLTVGCRWAYLLICS